VLWVGHKKSFVADCTDGGLFQKDRPAVSQCSDLTPHCTFRLLQMADADAKSSHDQALWAQMEKQEPPRGGEEEVSWEERNMKEAWSRDNGMARGWRIGGCDFWRIDCLPPFPCSADASATGLLVSITLQGGVRYVSFYSMCTFTVDFTVYSLHSAVKFH